MTPRVAHVHLTSVRPPLSANQRVHWRRQADERRFWRDLTRVTVKAAKVPALGRIDLTLHVVPPDARRRDETNLVPYLLKPVEDGVVDAGVIPDDTPDLCTARVRLHEAGDDWRYDLEIREVVT